jgi:hypothetical protein
MPNEDHEVYRAKYASRRGRRLTAGEKMSADSGDYGCKPSDGHSAYGGGRVYGY